MTVSPNISISCCKNCKYWIPDKYNRHKACQLTNIPCGEFYNCGKYEPKFKKT